MSSMGARVTRMLRNFNLENRAHREIGRSKPRTAPRHPTAAGLTQRDTAVDPEDINQRNDPLLAMLKDVYVESQDPVSQSKAVGTVRRAEPERRPLKYTLPGDTSGICDITNVPKGKLSLLEALTALNNHKRTPKTWTTEKMAEEYCLDPKDAKALTDFFIPFDVKIIPPESTETKQIKDS